MDLISSEEQMLPTPLSRLRSDRVLFLLLLLLEKALLRLLIELLRLSLEQDESKLLSVSEERLALRLSCEWLLLFMLLHKLFSHLPLVFLFVVIKNILK